MKKLTPFLFIFSIIVVFFWQFLFKGMSPIPADTIVGLYHPFRDLYAKNYPNGIPFKNFLITDPVRQQYPWKDLVISAEKKLELPLWNPYVLSGTPLLANFQSGAFYVLNILFLAMPFSTAWSLIIFFGPLLSGIFLYLYLDNLKLSKWASAFGALTFSFSGFLMAWLEWGTITHVGLWLPLILLSIDKIFSDNKNLKWIFAYLLSLVFSFLAGHLQIFFYLFIFSWMYFFARWFQFGNKKNIILPFLIANLLFLILTLIQWIPTFQFIFLSARNVDVVNINNPGWFIPWQHLVQFIAPDYFGNPTTLNYWGVWNYGELVGYAGIIPLIFGIFALYFRRDRKTLFFGLLLFSSLLFSLPTFFANLPYILKIPFLSTSQPTRLLFLIDFALAVLAALGFDYLLKANKKTAIFYPLIFISIVLTGLWIFIPKEHFDVVRSNLILPTLIFAFSLILFVSQVIFQKNKKITVIICSALLIITVLDLLRFGWKFNSFTQEKYLFPSTRAISYLKENLGEFRFMTTDSRILPPNFSSIYRLQSVDGYDPLYLQRYGELIAASERKKADITTPFGFNRIITPHNFESKIIDMLGVKYILSLSEINSSGVKKVFQEGQTLIYENLNVVPRAFFAKIVKKANNKDQAIALMFSGSFNPKTIVVVEGAGNELGEMMELAIGKVNIINYSENKVVIKTENQKTGFLVLTDSFYPTWRVSIDGKISKIYRTDYNLRGVIVPGGKHVVEFYNSLF
jgi:uncharacterized membrane protein YfhO